MDTEGADGSSQEQLRGRTDESRVKLYVLLEAHRWVLTGAILLVVFATLVTVGVLAPASLVELAQSGDPVATLFQALVTAIITGVTLVVTITQLVLSQELGPLGDQRNRMNDAMSVREDVRSTLDAPASPIEPADLLRSLLAEIATTATGLGTAADSIDDPVGSRLQTYVDRVGTEADLASDRLTDAEFGTYAVLSAALDFGYSVQLYDTRRLQHEHGEQLPEAVTDVLADLETALRLFAAVREHVKTLYFQWELTNLSREILYITVPALLVAIVGVLWLDAPGAITGTTAGVENLLWLVSGAATVGVAPFVLLVAYVLRIATVAKRTLAISPIVLRDLDPDEGVDWDEGR